MLQTIPGIQLDYQRTPGTFTFFNIQGALNTTVLVLIDGVRQNDFAQNMAEPGLIAVQQIERIEIVKGASSAAWGPAPGGVINIVTKAPAWDRPLGGTVSGSIGKRATSDSRLELSGARGQVGYYLTGGYINSDGLRPNNGVGLTHFEGKGAWLDPAGGTLTAAFSTLGTHRGIEEGLVYGGPVHDDDARWLNQGYLKYRRPLAARLTLDLDGYALGRRSTTMLNDRNDGVNIPSIHTLGRESGRGADARLSWGDSRQNLVTGVEYGHQESRSDEIAPGNASFFDRSWDRGAAYANWTLSLGPVTVLPGLRVDRTGISGNHASYTMGATLQATEKTLLRAYGSRGFGLPYAILQRDLPTVTTFQAGVESSEIPFLWVKGTFFHNRMRRIESASNDLLTNQNRQGFELEGRTVPMYGLSLTGGYTFTCVTDADTGDRLRTNSDQSVPSQLVKVGILYDHAGLGLRGALTGNYIDWNADAGYPAHGKGTVWDLHLSWKVRPQDELSPELFGSGRNLFSNVQTVFDDLYANTPRWFEGGVRWRF